MMARSALSDVSNSPRGRGASGLDLLQPSGCKVAAAREAAPAQVSAEVMRKADQMLVRATEQIVERNAKIAELQAELRTAKRRSRQGGGEEVYERRLQALRREYDQAEAMRELRLADAQMQVHRHEREAQHLQHRVDEQTKEVSALTDRARRAETNASSLAQRHSTALSKLQNELTQVRASGQAEAAAAARELRAAREKLHTEEAACEAAARMASNELQQVQEAMRVEAERLGVAQERNDALELELQTLRTQFQDAEQQRQLDLEASSAVQRELQNEADCTARRLENTRNELCEMEQAADTAVAGWNEEKDVRVQLQRQVIQKEQADAAAAAMEQSMALATVAEMQQLRADKARLTTELKQAEVLYRSELDGLKNKLADAVLKANASETAATKQLVRQQQEDEDVVAKATLELENVRAQLRSQREIEDATAAVNRELDDVGAQLADEMEARLATEAKWEKARDALQEAQAELDTLRQEQELQQLVASSAPQSLPSPSPVVRIDRAELEHEKDLRAEAESQAEQEKTLHSQTRSELEQEKQLRAEAENQAEQEKTLHSQTRSELEQEKQLRAEAENQAEQEKTLHSQTRSELEQAVALGEEATGKVEVLTAELAAAQKGRGALLLEIEHQHDQFTAASERTKEAEAEADAAVSQAAELQNDLAAAARLLDAASTGLETEKRRSAALSQQMALIVAEARRTAEMQDAEMRAWVTLGTRYGTRFGSARSESTPSPPNGGKQSELEGQGNNALTPWHTPGMARWPSLSPMSLSRARAPATQSPTVSPGASATARCTGSAFATLDRCDQLIEQLEAVEEQVEAAAHQQLETVHHLQDDVAKLHEPTTATTGVTWADSCHVTGVSADSPNTVRRVMATDIRRMLLGPAGLKATTTPPATEADGLGQMIAQQQAEQRQKQLSATTPERGTLTTDDSCGGVADLEGAESLLEQSLQLELDEARMELMAGDRVELAGKAALAGAHRASELVKGQLRIAEARAEQAEQQCKELQAQLAEQESVPAAENETANACMPMAVICPDDVEPGDMVEVTAPSGELMQIVVPEGVKPGGEFQVDVDVGTEPEPEPELELDPEPETESADQDVQRGPSLVERMKEVSCCHESEQISRTLVHRMKSVASTQEQARLISDAASTAVVEVTVELMVARTETAFAHDQVMRMRATAAEADERAVRAACQLQEQCETFEREKLAITASFEHRLADAEEARLHYEERLATTLEELSTSLELSEQRNERVNDLEMDLATAEDKVVALRDELAQAVDASLAASRNKMAMVEEWKAQRASLKTELKDCNMCRDALVAENDGLRRRLRAEGKPGTPMRTPGKKLTLRKESAGRRTSVLRQTMGAEKSPETTPERPRWNRV